MFAIYKLPRLKLASKAKKVLVRMSTPDYNSKWEGYWGSEKGVPIGDCFDAGRSSPALGKLLEAGTVVSAVGKTALVPGCGRGWDVIQFVKHGASSAVGLELSPTAVKVADEFVTSALTAQGLPAVKAQVVEGDWLSEASCTDQFDVGYDFTFFCALHPSMRKDWAKGWQRRLNAGGRLITLMFPVVDDLTREGPPWPVTPEMYQELLVPQGFKLIYQEPVDEAQVSKPDRVGKEVMAVWEKVTSAL